MKSWRRPGGDQYQAAAPGRELAGELLAQPGGGPGHQGRRSLKIESWHGFAFIRA